MTAINKIIHLLGRTNDGYGGAARLARELGISVVTVYDWVRRGWISPIQAAACSKAVDGQVSEAEILEEVHDKRLRKHRNINKK